MKARIPNPTRRAGLRSIELITDRAKRYRAAKNPPPGPRQCHYCGARRNVEVEHVDGFEEHTEPRNLTWACRACNTIKGVVFRNAGLGRRTRQWNPGKETKGARNLGQWLNAVMAIRGEGGTMSIPEAVAMIHATPHSKRSEFAGEIWSRRRARGTDRKEEVPF